MQFRIFFKKDDISWQAPGRKDRVISLEILSNGKTSKTTAQVRYKLMSLKEAYLFREQMKCEVIGLLKFCSLRPVHIKLFEQIPQNVCRAYFSHLLGVVPTCRALIDK